MGGTECSLNKTSYGRARSLFTTLELNYYGQLYAKFCGNSNKIDWEVFQSMFDSMWGSNYVRKLFEYFCSAQDKEASKFTSLDLDTFIFGLAYVLKGDADEKLNLFFKLCETDDARDSNELAFVEVKLVVNKLVDQYMNVIRQSPSYQYWTFEKNSNDDALFLSDYFSNNLETYLTKSGHIDGDNFVPRQLIQKWLIRDGSIILEMISCAVNFALEKALPGGPFIFPLIPTPTNNAACVSILNLPSVVILSNNITVSGSANSNAGSWKLLYDSKKHGESFTNMLKSIMDEGPLLVVVQEKETNYTFGGFCSTNMNLNPNFVGDDRCFVFSISPYVRVFPATGFNGNYAYLNAYQATMPNGLGFGGRLQMDEIKIHFFSLWLDQDFGRGKSQAYGSTYSSPQLSAKENFDVEKVEIWAVGRKPDTQKRRDSKSILDSNPEMKAILAMTGKGPVSEGLRDFDETADIPEDRKFMNA
uniref:MTOR-associated protein MEAK7 n=1 Tax=Romanomermis culicivorax TaxID=13658 RepID=A0A915JA67_ROMCU